MVPGGAFLGSVRRRAAVCGLLGLLVLGACKSVPVAGPQADGTGITPQGWRIAPAGLQSALDPSPLAIAVRPDGGMVLVAHGGYDHQSLLVLDAEGRLLQRLGPKPGKRTARFTDGEGPASGYYAGLAFSPDGSRAYASDGAGDAIHSFRVEGNHLVEGPEIALPPPRPGGVTYPAGIAVSRDGAWLYVAGNLADDVAVVEAATGRVAATIPVGHLPFAITLDASGTRAYVTNWGARTVSQIDLVGRRVSATIETGTHPSAILANPRNDEIYAANADSDSVVVLEGRTGRHLRRIDLHPYAGAPIGASPDALALSPDGATLYVANALDDDVAVIGLDPAGDTLRGLIPTGWYPSAAATMPSGSLLVCNFKGLGAGPAVNNDWTRAIPGTLSRIAVPDAAALAEYTRQVRRNDRFGEAAVGGDERRHAPAGIRHVIYVLKENRTFDQVLGDLGRGNGDPSLALFGEAVTPNQHALARRFVTFDNFYADSEVSVDGWSWSNGGYANSYVQKNWPLEYGNWNRPDDMGGYGNPETAGLPGEKPGESFIWDALGRAGVDYVNFGFFVNNPPVVDASMTGLLGHTDPLYPGWDLDTTDQTRIERWLEVFHGYLAKGEMPTVQFITLPSDHTSGTTAGKRTPRAYVADNDLALGRLVEAVSTSRFWADTAIFVVEDDAQDGPDHVDGHRTVAFVISAYTQRGTVDSSFYSSVSMLRTIELVTGVAPMSQFDAAARPLTASFASVPDLAPYRALPATLPLDERNGPEAPLAKESSSLDFSRPDRIPMGLMNLILWRSIRGPDSEPPPTRHAAPLLAHREAAGVADSDRD